MSLLVAGTSNTIRLRVLHIRPQPPGSREGGPRRSPIDELLAGLPPETEWYGDVYRGLAGLLRPASDPPRAVIVCLDGLGPAEFEFFSIVSRLRRDLKVYVYAATRTESRIARAVELGAQGPVTRDILTELAGGAPNPARPIDQGQASSRGAEPRLTAPPAEAGHDKSVASTDAPEPIESPRTRHEARRAVRVPWLHYADRPVRIAPPRNKPSPQGLESSPQTPDLPRAYEPLLTDEELRALMSDDAAPTNPDARDSGDEERIRGVS